MGTKWNFSVLNIFSLVMVVVYLGSGIFILATDKFNYVRTEIRVVFGSFLIIYGIFRLVRVYFKLKNQEHESRP